MGVMVMYNRNLDQSYKKFLINFRYPEENYQEIENVRDFGFESFWSAVGGFIGIFMGYSMLQIPELLSILPPLFRRLKNKLYSP